MKWHPLMVRLIRGASGLHTRLFRAVGGRGFLGRRTLLLTTRGRKTGGDRFYVVASFGGNDTPPGWYRNLRAHPEVMVELGGASRRCRARSLEPAEAAPIWPKLLAMYPTYADYQKRTTRVIPVVELSPI
jgi:F420H(2)-dependent quinone reductase